MLEDLGVEGGFWSGVVGGVTAIVAKEAAAFLIRRKMVTRRLARDVLAAMLPHLAKAEELFDLLVAETQPTRPRDLIPYHSHWLLRPLGFGRDRLLGAFPSDALHHELVLYYDAFDAFMSRNQEHHDSFRWLLEHADVSWYVTAAEERLRVLEGTRQWMIHDARMILHRGYGVVMHLIKASKWISWLQKGAVAGFRIDDARFLRAYYAADGVRQRPGNRDRYGLVVWYVLDRVTARPWRSVTIEFERPSLAYPEKVTVRLGTEVAHPLGAKVLAYTLIGDRDQDGPRTPFPEPFAVQAEGRTISIPLRPLSG